MESIRLHAQHNVLAKRLGWTVLSKISQNIIDDPSFKIADLATATGIVALEMNEAYPHASIQALDISDAQFPTPITIPSAVSFGCYNLFEEPPAKLRNAFDFIHVRLIAAALFEGGQDQVVKNLHSLLNQGGWLQWTEVKPPFFRQVDTETFELIGPQARFVEIAEPYLQFEKKLNWIHELGELFEETGFNEVEG
jgi:hypothetical protein